MKRTSRHPRPRLDTTLFRERLGEERVPLHLPPPPPSERRPEPERTPEGGTCIIIQVWPTGPEPSDEETDRAQ